MHVDVVYGSKSPAQMMHSLFGLWDFIGSIGNKYVTMDFNFFQLFEIIFTASLNVYFFSRVLLSLLCVYIRVILTWSMDKNRFLYDLTKHLGAWHYTILRLRCE